MCGIICEICHSGSARYISKDPQVLKLIHRRGPDCTKTVDVKLKELIITLCGSVLWMQGPNPVPQPIVNNQGALLFNGDIFDWEWDCENNDTEQIMEMFNCASSDSSEKIINEIKKLKGPFSLIYLNKTTNEIIFCRDRIGRNSLLFLNNGHSITISSVLGRNFDCAEIPASHVYILNLITNKVSLYSWDMESESFDHKYRLDEWLDSVKLLQSLPDEKFSLKDNIFIFEKDPQVLKLIHRRGPDCTKTVDVKLKELIITLCGSVLWMQGPNPVPQPIVNNQGALLFNGDIFDWEWDCENNDTEQIMEMFNCASSDSSEKIINEIKKLKGPFSLIYLNKTTNEIIFCRDRIGRNSLLFLNNGHSITISSVLGRNFDCAEIPASHVYILNLITNKVSLYSWDMESESFDHKYRLDEWLDSVKLLQSLPDEKFSLKDNIFIFEKDLIIEYIEKIATDLSDKFSIMQTYLNNIEIENTVMQLLVLLNKSIEIRVKRQPNKCKTCLNKTILCNHSSVGILFSGGLDCTILAYLADKYVPKDQSIDLLNVAFRKDDNASYDVPDRLTGKQSFEELKRMCPHRNWIFKEINVPKTLLLKQQQTTIADLVFPRQTILDESLGSALWFAAQGDDNLMQSPSRVLLLGSGADELFGGYTRHRNAFKRNSWAGLSKELLLDWKRISFRNLARDNRVICDHGRQPRMPYLDEDFAQYVLNLKPWFKCFPSEHLEPGIGDKLFLRLLAFHLGLRNVAVLPKRALQFGSRIANKKEKGSDLSKNFINMKNTVV